MCWRVWPWLLAILVTAACGGGPAADVAIGAPPAPSGTPPDVVAPVLDGLPDEVECAGVRFSAAALQPVGLASDVELAEEGLAILEGFLESGEGDWWPQGGYWVLSDDPDWFLLVHHDRNGTVTMLGAEDAGDGWRHTAIQAGDACPIRVPLPSWFGEVRWRLDPSAPPTADSTEIHLLATGSDCSSGQPMGDRLEPPQVAITDTEVVIGLVARRPTGNQTCQGNPEEAVTVELDEPLGDRSIVDARSISGLLTDFVPVSPCGSIIEPIAAAPDPTTDPGALTGPPAREPC